MNRLVALYQAGKLNLRELVARTYHLGGINPDGSGLAAPAAGEGARRDHPLVTRSRLFRHSSPSNE